MVMINAQFLRSALAAILFPLLLPCSNPPAAAALSSLLNSFVDGDSLRHTKGPENVMESSTSLIRLRSGDRSLQPLATPFRRTIVREGDSCNVNDSNSNICNGTWGYKARGFLYCCKNHCRDIYGDRNNCGGCGTKCSFGQLCCNGICSYVGDNNLHCGNCNTTCLSPLRCEMGVCGYAG